jgi:hypothetical protein
MLMVTDAEREQIERLAAREGVALSKLLHRAVRRGLRLK